VNETGPVTVTFIDTVSFCRMRVLRCCMEISLEKHPINEEMTTEVDSKPSQSEIS